MTRMASTLSSNYNSVYENSIIDNWKDGIDLGYSSNYNSIFANNIDNDDDGIELYNSSSNRIHGNNITKNYYGIYLSESSDNVFYHNNFIYSQVHDKSWDYPSIPPSVNVWDDDYPSGGNYWSNYAGTDLSSGPYQNETRNDGIGDTPYIIDANNADLYPLMGSFSDFNVTSEYQVQTICNSTISDFHFNSTAISFNVFGENGTTGFCRICVPTALMNGAYKVFVNGTEVSHTLLPCSNSTHSCLYFTYNHSTQKVVIIPEFPSLIILPLFMIATILAAIAYRRKHSI